MKIASIAALAALLATAAALAGVGRPTAAHGALAGDTRTITVSGQRNCARRPRHGRLLVRRRDRRRDGTVGIGGERRGHAARDRSARRRRSPACRPADAGRLRLPEAKRLGSARGFTASGSVSATVRDIARAGKAVDAAVAAGANQVSGPQFERSEPLRALPAGAAHRVRRRQGEGAGARRGSRRRARPGAADRRERLRLRPVYPMAMRAARRRRPSSRDAGGQRRSSR